jgi:predicted nucleic acid-binding protein
MNREPAWFLDTNVVIYAFEEQDARSLAARGLLDRGAVVSVQVLNEFTVAVGRRLGFTWPEARSALAAVRELCRVVPLTVQTHERALEIAERYRFSLWDGLVIAAALEAGCGTLYSEDMQDGQRIEGMTIWNPFRGRS